VFSAGLFAFAAQLSWQIAKFRIGDSEHCLKLFKSNRDAGLILFAAMVLDVLVWHLG
jgi:4-hydroxybenzoate polyprenyltransferase